VPFAGYPDFDACVSENSDKSDPQAFCAWLEHKATGQWPGQMTQGLPAPVSEKFWAAFEAAMANESDEKKAIALAAAAVKDTGWSRMKQGWTRIAENKMKTRQVIGVPIFAVGTHNGDKYTATDLQSMVDAFGALTGRLDPPVKIGHTSDEFNQRLALKMGIDADMIKGEAGNGVMAFGWVEKLRISEDTLYADLSDVPEPVAELIESKAYNKVSAEVLFNYEDKGKKYPKVLCGLALLGAELPAVRESGLETAAVYAYSASHPDAKVVEYEVESNTKEEGEMDKALLAELGLAEQAKDGEVITAVKGLKALAEVRKLALAELGLAETATPEDLKQAIGALKAKPEAKQFSDRIAALETANATLTRNARVAYFTTKAGELKVISGKPEELAEELTTLEEKAGTEVTTKVLARYKAQNDALIAAGVFKARGTPAEGEAQEHEFSKKVKAHMKEKCVDEPTAQAAVRKAEPTLFKDFMATRPRIVTATEPEDDGE